MNPDLAPVALVTGAGRGLGRELALGFAAAGYRLAIDDLSPDNLEETRAQIAGAGQVVRAYDFDMARKMPAQALVEAVLEEWGRIDVLVNGDAVAPHQTLDTLDEWDWQRTIEVNLSGPFYLMQAVGRIQHDQGGGVILNVAAAQALELLSRAGSAVQVGRTAFLASQAGLIALSRAAAAEFAPEGIRVHLLCPAGSTREEYSWLVEQALELAGPRGQGIHGKVILFAGSN